MLIQQVTTIYVYITSIQIFWATTDRFHLAPLLLQVSIQLYTAREKQQLADLVDTMISYNLTYQQERGADGQYTYVLDP